MDLQTLKNMMRIDTTDHDEYLIEMLPVFIEQAKDYCNNSFMVAGEEVLPSGVRLYVAKAIEFSMNPSNVKSYTMGQVSYSYETDVPRSITKYLAPYRKVRFV
ncbi:phage head-tail connector protein [Bacillus sp. MCCB 382]|uniref:phage head-tail connector protein n=1 Tax=Bacillus sp. MCCB 382 TaxID=2860197 RepID=UPI001C574CC1|nr:phage head-tail connector protein [Bacillus sp. MCCB 382]